MTRRGLDKNFCVIPWTGFEVDPDGGVKNCIISKDTIGNLNNESIQDIIKKNAPIRKQMMEGEFPNSCSGCYLQEKNREKDFGSISSRLYYAREVTPHITKGLFDSDQNFELRHVDVRWSNKCNLACAYCGPMYSSKWESELKEKPKKIEHNESLQTYLYENIESLRNVYLAGGEPMLMKENLEFLKLLKEKNPECMIRVNTNLSTTETGIFDLLVSFRNVHWIVSVEATGQEYEYIRHHGSWNDFQKNLMVIKNLEHKISFNMLHFILNYESLFDCVDHFGDLGFHDNSFIIGPLYSPIHMNLLNLPRTTVDRVIKKIQQTPIYSK